MIQVIFNKNPLLLYAGMYIYNTNKGIFLFGIGKLLCCAMVDKISPSFIRTRIYMKQKVGLRETRVHQ